MYIKFLCSHYANTHKFIDLYKKKHYKYKSASDDKEARIHFISDRDLAYHVETVLL